MSWKLYPSITSIGLRLFDFVFIIIGFSEVGYDEDFIRELDDEDSIDDVDDKDFIGKLDDVDAWMIEDHSPF